MSFVCKWLGLYLCIREPPPTTETLLADKCNILVVLKEDKKRESSGGLAFEVILKPAMVDSPLAVKTGVLGKEISIDDIEKKLRAAKERRDSLEASRREYSLKDRQRRSDANQRIQELNDSFSHDAEKKLAEKMELTAENKKLRIASLQDQLNKHALRVEEVNRRLEQQALERKEKIERKTEVAEEKRKTTLDNKRDNLHKHLDHVYEVIEESKRFSKDTEWKVIQKMEASQNLREQQLNRCLERLKAHDRHGEQVRQNKLNQSTSSESFATSETLSMDISCSSSMSETDITVHDS